MAEQKQFHASKRKIEKSRREGRTLRTPLFSQLAVIIAIFCLVLVGARPVWVSFEMLLQYSLTRGFQNPLGTMLMFSHWLFVVGACLFGGLTLCGALAEAAQVGLRVDAGILAPRGERLDWASGIKKIGGGFKQLGILILRITIFGSVGGFLLWKTLGTFGAVEGGEASQILNVGIAAAMRLGGWSVGIFALFSGADYLLKRREFFRDLSMDQEEVRREYKEEEGDPHMKSARRSMHESLMMQDLVRRVKRAKVIVVERNEKQ